MTIALLSTAVACLLTGFLSGIVLAALAADNYTSKLTQLTERVERLEGKTNNETA